MQRFFVEPYQVLEEEHRITLTGPDLNHMKNVLRMRIGEDVWISDGSEKEYHCTIEEFQEDSAVLHILYAQESQYELLEERVRRLLSRCAHKRCGRGKEPPIPSVRR